MFHFPPIGMNLLVQLKVRPATQMYLSPSLETE